MRNLDQTAIEQYGITQDLLMENAGGAVAQTVMNRYGAHDKKVLVFSGIGNNGGDGFVAARKLHSNGASVTAIVVGDPSRYTGAARSNFERAMLLPINTYPVETMKNIEAQIRDADVVVDALFGTGITREVGGLYRDVIDAINAYADAVVSVDIPSGVNGDTGEIMGTAVRADVTVTFGLPKRGSLLYPGYGYCGDLFITHISFPPKEYDNPDIAVQINSPVEIPPRREDGHKGTFGNVLCIAGAAGYYGAPYFSVFSFLKAGGGYARLATPRSLAPFIANRGPEIVIIPLDETDEGSIAYLNKNKILEQTEKVDCVIVGPGISLNEETAGLVRECVEAIHKPLIIDGDGITAVSESPECIKRRQAPTVLTPHPGEMARLCGKSVLDITAGRINILQDMVSSLGATIVFKGAHSLIGLPGGDVYINMSGNSGMGTAGSGDVLTGTIAAMFCLGCELNDAVRTGVFCHGLAGDLAAASLGEDGITAQDILECLPEATNILREDGETTEKGRYMPSVI